MDGNPGDVVRVAQSLEDDIARMRAEVNKEQWIIAINAMDVREVLSPPRVVEIPKELGLAGWRSVYVVNGLDFSKYERRRSALKMMRGGSVLCRLGDASRPPEVKEACRGWDRDMTM